MPITQLDILHQDRNLIIVDLQQHTTLPFGTKVKVTNVNNGKSVVVTINDRGPFKRTPDFKYYYRVLDLAKGAFLKIASAGAGVIKIKYEILE